MTRFAIALLLAAPALGGCDYRAKMAAEAKHAVMEQRIAELEARVERLEVENRELRASRVEPPDPVTPIGSAAVGRCRAKGSGYVIPRADVDALFDDLNSWSREIRIVPYFQSGVPEGFKLFSIRPDSVFATCGLQNGDVVKTVNGFELDSPEKALDMYTKMRGARSATLEIVRAGKPAVVTIEIED